MELIKRNFTIENVILREASDGKPPMLSGHAAVFSQWSPNLGSERWPFFERILPGAFKNSLEGDGIDGHGIRAFWNHSSLYVLGRTSAGTLRIWEDETGLAFELDISDSQIIRDLVIIPLQRGDIGEMSFGFMIPKGGETLMIDGDDEWRTIKEATLIEISPVAIAAYPTTDVGLNELLDNSGINSEAVAGVLTRARQGEQITTEDTETLNAAIAALRSHLPTEPDGSDTETEDENLRNQDELSKLSRLLRLRA